MFRKFLIPLAVLSSVLYFVPPAASQNEEAAEVVAIEGTRFPVTLEAHEIPEFSVVSNFFRRISMVHDHAQVYEKLLTDIGIEPGSQGDEFLADVTDRAMAILNINTVDGTLTGDAFMEHQYNALQKKARNLGIVFRQLLLGLEELGISMESVKTYCEETIRPSIKVFSTELDNTRYLKVVAEFEKQLSDLQ